MGQVFRDSLTLVNMILMKMKVAGLFMIMVVQGYQPPLLEILLKEKGNSPREIGIAR